MLLFPIIAAAGWYAGKSVGDAVSGEPDAFRDSEVSDDYVGPTLPDPGPSGGMDGILPDLPDVDVNIDAPAFDLGPVGWGLAGAGLAVGAALYFSRRK